MSSYKTEIRDNMRIEWDVPITMDDGLVLDRKSTRLNSSHT